MTTYEEIGRAFIQALCTSQSLGHASCAGLADYADSECLLPEASIVLDAFACARLDSRADAAKARVADWLATEPLALDTMRRGAEAAGRIG